jgi:hypothetical protein
MLSLALARGLPVEDLLGAGPNLQGEKIGASSSLGRHGTRSGAERRRGLAGLAASGSRRTESLGSGRCARKRNFCGRDEAAETVSLKFNWPFAENSFGHFAMHEIPTSGPLVNA